LLPQDLGLPGIPRDYGLPGTPLSTKHQTTGRLSFIDQSSEKVWLHMKFHLMKNL
jgi:hypothetical protein